MAGDDLTARQLWQEAAEICKEWDLKPLLGPATIRLGFSLVQRGETAEGIAEIRGAFDTYGDAISAGSRAWGLGLFALALGASGQSAEGLTRIEEALSLARTKKPDALSSLYRFKGKLVLMNDVSALTRAKQCFSAAIEVARKTGAKSHELTASIELARILIRQDRRAQARTLLSKTYNWFTEGFDTPDLKDAKALLDELRV